jgi:methyl-accepting chemotaxis protein
MNLDDAIAKHAEWKLKFRSAISKQETMDVDTIAKDNCCELGKWLYGEGKSKFGHLASYSACVTKHAAFHIEAAKVAKAINSKKFQEAEAMISSGSTYSAASSAVGTAIMALKKEARL